MMIFPKLVGSENWPKTSNLKTFLPISVNSDAFLFLCFSNHKFLKFRAFKIINEYVNALEKIARMHLRNALTLKSLLHINTKNV